MNENKLRTQIRKLEYQLEQEKEDALRESLNDLRISGNITNEDKIKAFDELRTILVGYVEHAVERNWWDRDNEHYFLEIAARTLLGEEGAEKMWEIRRQVGP